MISYDDVEAGAALPTSVFPVTRADLVRYAGASGDFNPIHWNERVAGDVGLPDVIAHGMYTMGLAGRAVTDWVGDPAAVIDFSTRFTRPVVVPNTKEGAEVEVSGVIKRMLENRQVLVELTVSAAGVKVLGQARATVQLV